MMTSDDKVGGWVKKGQNHDDVILEWFLTQLRLRDHPFKMSACLRGGGVKNLPFLPTDSTKKLPTVGG